MLRLTWAKTGDSLDIDPVSLDFAEFFVNVSNKFDNNWALSEWTSDWPKALDTAKIAKNLRSNIEQINQCCDKLKIPVYITEEFDHTKQEHLNQLHSVWVSIIRQYPNISIFFNQIDKSLLKNFNDINNMVHLLENGFAYSIRDKSSFWQHENIFKKNQQPWGEFNVELVYADIGRCGFEKFLSNCSSVVDSELVNWDTICSRVRIRLIRPYETQIPYDYLSFCKQHGLIAHSQFWPLGNIHDWQNMLTTARKIMERNIFLPNNYAVFTFKN